MITLFDSRLSLNCYKIRLLLSILKVSYVRQAVDLRMGEHKSQEMLAMNPFGQVPVLRTDSLALRDSTAILVWIAQIYGSDEWIPRDADAEAEVNAWLMASAFELRLGHSGIGRLAWFYLHRDRHAARVCRLHRAGDAEVGGYCQELRSARRLKS